MKGHWLACACEVLGIASMEETISLPSLATDAEKLAFISNLARQVVDKATLVDSAFLSADTSDTDDRVYNYSRVLCHYGSLAAELRDGWAEGDGERTTRCWRLFLPHFKASGCTKYALEALRLHIQFQVLSPNLAHQVKWHRFVNTRGGMGMNIPCDLYNEHVNKLVKTIIQNMGPNLTEKALQRAVRCVSPLHAICKKFDAATHVPTTTSAHSSKSDAQDIAKVVSVVLKQKLLVKGDARKHQFFPNMKLNPLDKWDRVKTRSWIKEKKRDYGRFKGRFREMESVSSGEGID